MIFITIAVAFVLSVLSGLGVGGGGLLVIFLSLFTDTPQLTAQGLNLLFFLFSSSSSLIVHLKERKIFENAVVIMVIAGIIGAILGSIISNLIDESLLRKIFGAMLTLTGLISLFGRQKSRNKENKI